MPRKARAVVHTSNDLVDAVVSEEGNHPFPVRHTHTHRHTDVSIQPPPRARQQKYRCMGRHSSSASAAKRLCQRYRAHPAPPEMYLTRQKEWVGTHGEPSTRFIVSFSERGHVCRSLPHSASSDHLSAITKRPPSRARRPAAGYLASPGRVWGGEPCDATLDEAPSGIQRRRRSEAREGGTRDAHTCDALPLLESLRGELARKGQSVDALHEALWLSRQRAGDHTDRGPRIH